VELFLGTCISHAALVLYSTKKVSLHATMVKSSTSGGVSGWEISNVLCVFYVYRPKAMRVKPTGPYSSRPYSSKRSRVKTAPERPVRSVFGSLGRTNPCAPLTLTGANKYFFFLYKFGLNIVTGVGF
jgi:hypothetical protein